MIKCFVAAIVGFAMLVGSTEASAGSCKNGVCGVVKTVISAPVNVVKQVQPVKRLAGVPNRASKWLANRPVRSLVGRIRGK